MAVGTLPVPFAGDCRCLVREVVGVIDGDSMTVLHDGRQEQIRLSGIDRREKNQDFGTQAKYATSIATIFFCLPSLSFRLQLSSANHSGRLCLRR